MLPEVSPLRHSSPRERLQKCTSPVSRVRASASAFMYASVSTSPVPASCITHGTRPSESKAISSTA